MAADAIVEIAVDAEIEAGARIAGNHPLRLYPDCAARLSATVPTCALLSLRGRLVV